MTPPVSSMLTICSPFLTSTPCSFMHGDGAATAVAGVQEGALVGVGPAQVGEVLGVIEGEGGAVFGQVAQAGEGRTVAENGDRSILVM